MAVVPPEETSVIVDDLIEGFIYYFRVFAENKMGLSEPCDLHRPIEALNDFSKFGLTKN